MGYEAIFTVTKFYFWQNIGFQRVANLLKTRIFSTDARLARKYSNFESAVVLFFQNVINIFNNQLSVKTKARGRGTERHGYLCKARGKYPHNIGFYM
ncbi:hypothetical protein HMPREF9304_13950 [Hoylesella timonensis S9-PR14]|uniref:Uncharacterized protein n=2 Tax=Hoylesella timonensis TaxID=386414 RepID=A0A098YNG7_9BACT|nr:hypothetical protein HMPREF9304_13950 [Hoylesella timonensis S9-PR14]PMC07289.1 hypothetical protein CJ232_11560 [Hoylesella timonensis]